MKARARGDRCVASQASPVKAAPPTTLRVAGGPEGCRFAAAGPNNVRQGCKPTSLTNYMDTDKARQAARGC